MQACKTSARAPPPRRSAGRRAYDRAARAHTSRSGRPRPSDCLRVLWVPSTDIPPAFARSCLLCRRQRVAATQACKRYIMTHWHGTTANWLLTMRSSLLRFVAHCQIGCHTPPHRACLRHALWPSLLPCQTVSATAILSGDPGAPLSAVAGRAAAFLAPSLSSKARAPRSLGGAISLAPNTCNMPCTQL